MINRKLLGVILILSVGIPVVTFAQELPPLPSYTPSDTTVAPTPSTSGSTSSSASTTQSSATSQAAASTQTTSSKVTSADTGTNTLILALVAGGLSILAVIWWLAKNKRAS